MTTLRTLIVDDEPLALELLRSYLNAIAEIEIVAECVNGKQAIEATMELAPDLIFLDIQMPGINGLEVVKKLQADIVPLVVFATAYEQYAVDAFDIHAVDYILKPLDEERVLQAVRRALDRFDIAEDHGQKPGIIAALDQIKQRSAGDSRSDQVHAQQSATDVGIERKIVVKDRDAITLLKQNDIEWVDAAGDYVCLHVGGVTHIMRSTMKDLMRELDPTIFRRVHRSTIVNLNCIEKVIPHTKGEFILHLGEFEQIKVSRNYRDAIKSFLSDIGN